MSVTRASNQRASATLFDLCHLYSGLDPPMKLIQASTFVRAELLLSLGVKKMHAPLLAISLWSCNKLGTIFFMHNIGHQARHK